MKQRLFIIKRRLQKLDPSRLLSSSLLGILLIIYIYTVYAIVVTLGTFPFGKQPELKLLPTMDQWQLNSIALLCLALTIVPVSRWLHTHVNDLVYAQHDNPYVLPAQVNHQLNRMNNLQLTMPQVLEIIGTTLHLPYIAFVGGAENEQVFSYGAKRNQVEIAQYPIRYFGQQLAMLLVSNRAPNRPLSLSDHEVLQECAQQIGISLYVAELTADLQTSREKLIITREEERRRIRNDLHDGLAPILSSCQLQLSAIRKLITDNPTQTEQMIEELSADLRRATIDIRRLVYDLRPPRLDELGLVEALRSVPLSDVPLRLEVIAPDPLPALSAAAEVAIYRIVTEAVHNVAKHAQATTCTIALIFEPGTVTLTISDNGKGMTTNQPSGIGGQSMRERAAELGGSFTIQRLEPSGTCIKVLLPVRSEQMRNDDGELDDSDSG